jgi:NADH-quinone oxidoreductase subunit G
MSMPHRHGSRRAGKGVAAATIPTTIREKPSVVIVGQGALREADGEAVLAAAMKVAEATGSGLLVLHTAAPAWARWMWAR